VRVYDTSGDEITYTVTEDAVTGYTSEVTGDAASGFTITNTHVPETVSVSVRKEWVGPTGSSATVHLFANGADTGKTLVLTADGGWTGSFDDLDKYSAGEEISYTVKEDAVEGYASVVTGSAASGFVITNTQTTAAVTPSEPPAKDATPKMGDDGTPAGALAAIALGALGTAVSLRRKASGRSRL
jgi:hypothetical protein